MLFFKDSGLVAGALAWLALTLPFQRDVPARTSNAGPDIGSSSIAGAVIEGGVTESRPLSGVSVQVTGTNGYNATTLTREDGRFAFQGLPAGRYVIGAERPAYLRMEYGASRFGQPGTPIVVAVDQHVDGLRIAMSRGNVLAGRVVRSNGAPAGGALVSALRPSVDLAGEPTVKSLDPLLGDNGVATTRTDEHGGFRLFGLPPGRFVVQATLPAHLVRTGTYARGFYPAAVRLADAEVLRLQERSELTGLVLTLPELASVRVGGTVVSRDGAVQAAHLALHPDFPGRNQAVAGPDGRFAFDGVTQGTYVVAARATVGAADSRGQPVSMWGEASVSVTEAAVQDVIVALERGGEVSGQIAFDGPGGRRPARIRLQLQPTRPWQAEPPVDAQVDSRGFRIGNIAPGRYLLRATAEGSTASDAKWWVDTVLSDGRDVTDSLLDVGPQGIRSLLVTMTDVSQGVTGRLRTPQGSPATATSVIVFPSDRGLWVPGSRRIRIARPGTDGSFALRDLPAGDYRMIALLDPDVEETADPAFLATLLDPSFPVHLSRGEQKTLDLQTAW